MMSVPPGGMPLITRAYDASSSELRAYMRDEYRSNEAWLLAHARLRQTPWRTRLRRWWHARTEPRRTPGPAGISLSAAGAAASIPPRPVPDGCSHLVVEELGTAGPTDFVRCSSCGAVLVVNARAVWRLDTPSGWPRPEPISATDARDDDPRCEMPEP